MVESRRCLRTMVGLAATLATLVIGVSQAEAYATTDAFCGHLITNGSYCYDGSGAYYWARTDSAYRGGGTITVCSGAVNGPYGYEGCGYNTSYGCYFSNCSDQYAVVLTQYVVMYTGYQHTIYGYGYAD